MIWYVEDKLCFMVNNLFVYSYYNNEGADKRDIRAMLYSSFKDSTLFDSIHVDVLRLFPFTDGLLPNIEDTTVIDE